MGIALKACEWKLGFMKKINCALEEEKSNLFGVFEVVEIIF